MEAFSFYDILNEADDDNAGGTATDAAPADNPPADAGNNDSGAKDDDFDIDTSLDAGDDNGTDAPGGDANDAADEEGGDDESTDGGDIGADGDEEENQADHDIFMSLPKEEQQMKIRELKKQFGNMYTSCVDLCERLDDIEVSDDNKPHLARIYQVMSDIKTFIADYIVYIFPSKSYIENDIQFNTYLMIINSISGILDKIISKENKLRGDKDNLPEE